MHAVANEPIAGSKRVTDAGVEAVVWFDYGCPFSYLAQRWVDAAGARVDFRPFSLTEAHRSPGSLPVWQVPVDRLDPVVLSLAGHELVREAGGDLDEYRRRMLAFWHEESHRTFDGLVEILASAAGAPPTPAMMSQGLAAVKASHRTAAASGVFGTPTFLFGDEPGMFVKLDDLPADPSAARDLWQHLTAMTRDYPALLELKRTVQEG